MLELGYRRSSEHGPRRHERGRRRTARSDMTTRRGAGSDHTVARRPADRAGLRVRSERLGRWAAEFAAGRPIARRRPATSPRRSRRRYAPADKASVADRHPGRGRRRRGGAVSVARFDDEQRVWPTPRSRRSRSPPTPRRRDRRELSRSRAAGSTGAVPDARSSRSRPSPISRTSRTGDADLRQPADRNGFSATRTEEWRAPASMGGSAAPRRPRARAGGRSGTPTRRASRSTSSTGSAHKDGRWVWVRDQAVLVRDEDGSPRFWQGVRSTSRREKESEEQLREAEERYRAIVEHVPAAIYLDRPDADMETIYISPQIEEIAGVSPERWMADPEIWLALMDPSPSEMRCASRTWRSIRERRPWRAEYRIRRPDGKTVWIHDETTFLHDGDGEPSLAAGRPVRRHRAQARRAGAPGIRAARARRGRAAARPRRDEEHVPGRRLPRAAEPAHLDPRAVAHPRAHAGPARERPQRPARAAGASTPASSTACSRTCSTSIVSTAASSSPSTAPTDVARSRAGRSSTSTASPDAR